MALPSFVPALDVYQFGKQSDPDTPVAATEKMAVRMLNLDESGAFHNPQLAKGILLANRGNRTLMHRGTRWSIPETPVMYEQLYHFLNMSVAGGVSAVGASAPFTRTYARALAADPALNPYTIERRRSNGSANEDVEFSYALLSSIRFTFAQGEPLRFSAEGFGRKIASSTLTAAQAMPTVELPPSVLLTAAMDASYAELGDTPLAEQVLSGEVVFNTGMIPYLTSDGRTDRDFTLAVLNPDAVSISLRLQCLINATRLATERAAAAAGTLRAVQLHVAGTNDRELTINALVKYPLPDILAAEDRDGNYLVNFNLDTDTDESNPSFEVILVNNTDDPA